MDNTWQGMSGKERNDGKGSLEKSPSQSFSLTIISQILYQNSGCHAMEMTENES